MKTLRRRLAIQIALMCGGIALLGIAAVLGVSELRQDFSIALRANEQLRHIFTLGTHVAAAREPGRSSEELKIAAAQFDLFEWLPGTESQANILRADLRDAAKIDRTYTALADLSAATRQLITARQTAADQKYRIILEVVAVLSATIIFAAIWIGLRQYRSVMRPLSEIRQAVRRFATGELSQRVDARGDEEFASLAKDFNRMAEELHALYTKLEERVDAKSRQLVQSERLASVGYLAAGVAHEINNPLGIISGYAERSLQKMNGDWNDQTTAYVKKTIAIMRDEAFRCKQITDRLLMLARPGDASRKNISLATIAHEVVTSIGGLPRFSDHQITIEADPQANLVVQVNEGEMRQVVLNLVVNALEAGGKVHVAIARDGNSIELTVHDNGRGMSADTRDKIFEPFFTEKRSDRPGTGLGLSLAHAIVKDHDGQIDAHSEGVGRGSWFVVRLMAVEQEIFHAGRS